MEGTIDEDILEQNYSKHPTWEIIDALYKVDGYFGGVKNLFTALYEHIENREVSIRYKNKNTMTCITGMLLQAFKDEEINAQQENGDWPSSP